MDDKSKQKILNLRQLLKEASPTAFKRYYSYKINKDKEYLPEHKGYPIECPACLLEYHNRIGTQQVKAPDSSPEMGSATKGKDTGLPNSATDILNT